MQPVKPTKITVIDSDPVIQQQPEPQPPKKPRISKHLLKAIALIVITLVSWLNPEATLAIALVKLLFTVLEWLNQRERPQ